MCPGGGGASGDQIRRADLIRFAVPPGGEWIVLL